VLIAMPGVRAAAVLSCCMHVAHTWFGFEDIWSAKRNCCASINETLPHGTTLLSCKTYVTINAHDVCAGCALEGLLLTKSGEAAARTWWIWKSGHTENRLIALPCLLCLTCMLAFTYRQPTCTVEYFASFAFALSARMG